MLYPCYNRGGTLRCPGVRISTTSTRNIYSKLTSVPGVQPAKLYQQAEAKLKRKSTRRRVTRWALVGFNVLLLAAATIFVLQSAHNNKPASAAVSLSSHADTPAPASPLDQVSSSSIAVTVARLSNLPETSAVTNQADSDSAELAMTTSSSVVAKPQVVATNNAKTNKDIITYITVPGDTVSSLAAKYSVTSDSIRWSNNITGDALKPGTSLLIPPMNGIVYTVALGDTAETLAAKFNANKESIVNVNNTELSGLKVGERVLIPNGTKAATIARAARSGSFGWTGTATYGYNGYDYGYCTYWVAVLRSRAGNPVPSNLGNASTWATRAAGMGLPTGTTPRVGAAVVLSTRGAGHVAYVTAVNDDGTFTISEMNHEGWNKTDTRTLPTDSSYRYVY